MPRRLLRDRKVVDDEWLYAAETDIEGGGQLPSGGYRAGAAALIIPFDSWLAGRASWEGHAGKLGVILQPAHKVEALLPDLQRFALVAAEFPGPSEGRGYTQARLLRERYGFGGEMRAIGYVRRDILFFLARCGFNSFELPEHELESAAAAFSTFTAAYQPANDRGLRFTLSDTPASAEIEHPPAARS